MIGMEPLRRRLGRRLLLVALTVAGCYAWLRWFERRNVFQPTRQFVATGDEIRRRREDVHLNTRDGGQLHGWYFPGEYGTNGWVILFCHGNGGNISHRLDQYELLLGLGAAVLTFDYRGYGLSGGVAGEERTYRDAEAAFDWLRQQGHPAGRILVLGESLGGGVAAELAVRRPVGGVILQSTFTSVTDLGAEFFPWLPVRSLGSIHYETRKKLPGIRVPVLILHSRGDRVIPYRHAERNYAVAGGPKMLRELEGDHNDALEVDRDALRQGLDDFLALLETRIKEVDAGGASPPNAAGEPSKTEP